MSPDDAPAGAPIADVLRQLRLLAATDDPSARETVTRRLSELLQQDFDPVFDATQEWALDPDPRIREVTLLACRHRPDDTDEVRIRRLLGRVDIFVGDPDPEINEIWSRTVVPDLLGVRPEVVLPWLRDWTKNDDESSRAGVARAYGAAGDKFPTQAVEGLAEIGVDPRPVVREAVLASLSEIRERYPNMGPYLDSRFGALLGE